MTFYLSARSEVMWNTIECPLSGSYGSPGAANILSNIVESAAEESTVFVMFFKIYMQKRSV